MVEDEVRCFFDNLDWSIENAKTEFYEQNGIDEKALKELWGYDSTEACILNRVIVLNQLYSAGLNDNESQKEHTAPDVRKVAKYISENEVEIIRLINSDPIAATKKIMEISFENGGNHNNIYSFATKYCAWQAQSLGIDGGPLFDQYVELFVYKFFKSKRGCKEIREDSFKMHPKNLDELNSCNGYKTYCEYISKLKRIGEEEYGWVNPSLKDVDIFLWINGKKLKKELEENK